MSWLGKLDTAGVREQMRGAALLAVPSVWYEGGPMTMIEGWGVGLPVVGSDLGAMSSMIQPGENGLLFRPGDAGELAAQVRWLWAHPEERQRMRGGALQTFQDTYSPQRNYDQLIRIYGDALERASMTRRSPRH
ncbi:hypothetical protein DEMA109039_06970 [Deinococcus marmoris]